MSIKGQRLVQIGAESQWGTDVAPTVMLAGIDPDAISIAPSIVTERVISARGVIGPGRDTISPRHEVSGSSIGGHVIYEQIPYWLEMLHTDAAASGSGPYTYEYAAPYAAQVTPRLQTLVMGVGDAVYNVTSACAASMSFEWTWGQALTFSTDLMGHSVEADAHATLTEPTAANLTYALSSQCLLYIDAITGTVGATPAAQVLGGSININCNRKYRRRAGSLFPAGVYDAPHWDITGTLILEEDSTTAAIADAIIAGATSQLIRVRFTNGGLTTAERSLTFDIAGLCRVPSLSTDSDDLATIELQFESIETAAGFYFEIDAINNTAALY
jgi:hypothetical protein